MEAMDQPSDECIIVDEADILKDKVDVKSGTSVSCNLCNQFFTNQLKLRQHKVTAHKVNKICEVCGYVSNFHNINNHIRRYHPDFPIYKCQLCEASFSRMHDLGLHRKAKHTSKELRNAAKIKKLSGIQNVDRLKNPGVTENAGGRKSYKTAEIVKDVNSAQNSSDKVKEQIFSCEKCPKVFKSYKGLAVHRSHHKVSQSGCAICKKILSSANDILNHGCVATPAVPNGSFCRSVPTHCNKCFDMFLSPLDVNFHECSSKQTEENIFICGICGASYPTQKHLLGHMCLHTDEASIQCTLCRVGFTSVDSFEKHACLGLVDKAIGFN